MRVGLVALLVASLLGLGATPVFAVSMDCKPVHGLWTPKGIYQDSELGLRYRAEFQEYRCSVGGKKEVRVRDNREFFLGLPKGVWFLRYPPSVTVLFVREGVSEAGRAFAESLLKRGKVDLLLIHEGVHLSPDATGRARLVLRLRPGGHAISVVGEGFPIYRLATILDQFDIGSGKPTP